MRLCLFSPSSSTTTTAATRGAFLPFCWLAGRLAVATASYSGAVTMAASRSRAEHSHLKQDKGIFFRGDACHSAHGSSVSAVLGGETMSKLTLFAAAAFVSRHAKRFSLPLSPSRCPKNFGGARLPPVSRALLLAGDTIGSDVLLLAPLCVDVCVCTHARARKCGLINPAPAPFCRNSNRDCLIFHAGNRRRRRRHKSSTSPKVARIVV